MSECIYYEYKEGDYHCAKTNHDISDVEHVRKYCWGSCSDCPVYKGNQGEDHHRGTDECIYYCFKNNDYYCQKACKYIDKSTVDSCCRNHNYKRCTIYTGYESSSLSGQPGDSSSSTESGYTEDIFGCEDPMSSSRGANTESKVTDSSVNTGDFSAVSVIFSILGAIFIAVWKFIKTIPFWGPYGSILLLPFLMTASSSGNSSSGGAGVVVVFGLAYLVLHTILLFKCKKWNVKHKYWPIYGEFALLILGTLFGGAYSILLSGILVIAFQVGALIYMKQKVQDKEKPLCQGCGKQLQTNAKYCPSCGMPTKNEHNGENVTVPVSENSKQKVRRKIPLFLILPIVAIFLLSIIHAVQYSGYKSFVKGYFNAMETGDIDEIAQFYSWDYVESVNDRNLAKEGHPAYPVVWTYDSLEEFIEPNDKYYRWFAGEEIESIEITRTAKNLLSTTPQIKVEVYVDVVGWSDDIIVFMDMEKGSDGWYMTGTDAYYASDEAED